jgi:hypothetical protein
MGKSAGSSSASWRRTCTCTKRYDDGIYNSSALAVSVLGLLGGGEGEELAATSGLGGSPSVFEAPNARIRSARVDESQPGTLCVGVCCSMWEHTSLSAGTHCFVIRVQHQHETDAYGSRAPGQGRAGRGVSRVVMRRDPFEHAGHTRCHGHWTRLFLCLFSISSLSTPLFPSDLTKIQRDAWIYSVLTKISDRALHAHMASAPLSAPGLTSSSTSIGLPTSYVRFWSGPLTQPSPVRRHTPTHAPIFVLLSTASVSVRDRAALCNR